MAEPVYIHAGAHRTGTSSFQLCLFRNKAVLAERGLDAIYPGRDGVPEGRLRMDLPRPRHGLKRVPEYAIKLRRHLENLRETGRGMVLSEENIPGPMVHFYHGRFFPASGRRLNSLAQALGKPPAHVIFVLRPYAELYVSAYRKRAEDNPVADFSELVPAFMAIDRGWADLVTEIRDYLRPERLTVLEYGQRGQSRDLLARLVPGLDGLEEPDKVVNLSATDAALIALQERYHAGEKLRRPEWKAVLAEHAGDREPRGVAAFNEKQRAILNIRYDLDLERLAGMDGVNLVKD